MNFKTLSEKRYSVRSYSGEPVEEEQLHYILECARLAPSAVNLQPWKFYVLSSQEDRSLLQQCYKRDWLSQAPLYILLTVQHDVEWVRSDGKRHGDIDVAIAAEHICLAAAELGLGSCWVCNFDAQLCHRLLNLPEEEEAVVLIPIGKAAADSKISEKKRKDLAEIVIRR
ncbi:MAG: nitroreductase family protein [Bacteroidaceae bacterium]|nr:nitroreductase family protein [Bacteroidaceae bacterium]